MDAIAARIVKSGQGDFVFSRPAQTKATDGTITEGTPTTVATIAGWLQPASTFLINTYGQRQIVVTHKLYVATDPTAKPEDVITDPGGTKYIVKGVKNQAGLGRLFRVDVEELIGG